MSANCTLVVRIDPEKCQGHARCFALAPELFGIDEFGNASARGSGDVSPALEEKAWIAKANCPEQAVVVTDVSLRPA